VPCVAKVSFHLVHGVLGLVVVVMGVVYVSLLVMIVSVIYCVTSCLAITKHRGMCRKVMQLSD
jgi:hypothetical protein